MLETILDNFLEYGFRKFYLSVNYKADMIQAHFGDGSRWGIEIQYIQEDKRMGTAGALGLLPEKPRAPLLVMNGDLLTKVNFEQMLDFHLDHQSQATMCVREYNFQVPYGVVRMENHMLTGIEEKPVQRFLVNAGIYILDPQTIDLIPPGVCFDMPDLFKKVIAGNGQATAFPIREYWMDIGQMDDFERANTEFSEVFLMIGTKTVLAIIPARGGSKGVPREKHPGRGRQAADRLDHRSSAQVGLHRPAYPFFRRRRNHPRGGGVGLRSALRAPGRTGPRRHARHRPRCCTLWAPCPTNTTTSSSSSPPRRCGRRRTSTAASSAAARPRPILASPSPCPTKAPSGCSPSTTGGRCGRSLETAGQYTRRQNLPAVYALNGAVYVAKTGWLAASRSFVAAGTLACVMPPERSLDIDSETDLLLAGLLLNRPSRNP